MQPYAKKVALGSAIALSAGGGYLALNQRRPILMEAYLKREKLPIYPAPQPEIVLVETSSDLESHIAVAREQTTSVFRSVRDETQKVVSKWIAIERRVAAHVKRVVPADEPLTPGIAWVGVSTLAGSLVARNRTFLLRMIAPPAFFLISLPYFLPKLAANLSREVSATTAVRAPEFHGQAAALRHRLDDTFEHAEDWLHDTRDSVAGSVGKTVSFVERQTGLQLYQAFESSFSRRPEVGHHGHESEPAPSHERVAISAKPVDHATVPLFAQTPTTASTLPGTPIPAPGTTTAASPVQTLDVPIYRRVGGPASTTEQLDAAAARGLTKVEDKVADGVRAAKASDAGQAAADAADQAKTAVGSGLAGLKRKAEEALHSADHNAARAVGATADAVEAGERKLGQTVDAGKRKAGEAVDAAKASASSAADQAQAEANRVVSGLDNGGSLARTAGDKAKSAAGEAQAEASRVVRGLDNGADARSLAQTAGDKAKALAHEAQDKAAGAARAVRAKAADVAESAQDKAASAASSARSSEAAQLSNEGARAAHRAEAARSARQQAERAASATRAEASHLSSEASSLASEAQAKAGKLAHDAQKAASSAAHTVESKAAELGREGKALFQAGEDKARSALASAESKANRAASAVESSLEHAKAEAKDGLERVKSEASDAKRAVADADKRLKVDEQTVDGKRQEQPPVVGLLAGRERESGYKKLV